MTNPTDLGDARPTHIRYGVLALVCTLSMITYLDRVCFSKAGPLIAQDLGLSGIADLKWAITMFAIAYGAFEIPIGRLGDRLGPRSTLLRIVIWWSVCTALTGAIGLKFGDAVPFGLVALITLRFFFGMGEAGAYPNITRAVHNWFPAYSWETAQGMVWMSARLMGGLTPLVWELLVAGSKTNPPLTSWRGAFLLFGCVGLVWCAIFALKFRNRPDEHPAVNAAERELIGGGEQRAAPVHGPIPWRAFLRNRSLWVLCLMYMCITYGWYFNITYLPNYLKLQFQTADDDLLAALYQGGPLWVGAIGCLAGGSIIRRLTRSYGDRGKARRMLGVTALGLCACSWLAATQAPNMHWFFVFVSAGALLNDLTMGAAWATCQDLSRKHAAVAAAWMNTCGTLGAALAGWVTGTIVQYYQQAHVTALGAREFAVLAETEQRIAKLAGYNPMFVSFAVVYAVAAICWLAIDPKRTIEDA